MKLLRSLGGALAIALMLGLILSAVPMGAQTLNSLTMERTIPLNQVFTSITPSGIPANVLAALTSGALEIREQTNYNPQAGTLTSSVFTTAAGAPVPTNLGTVSPSAYIAIVTVSVDKIYVTSTAVQIVGTVTQSTATPYGSYQGSPGSFSFAYSKDTPPKISNVIESVAGIIGTFSATATGTVSITQPPGGGGPGGGGGSPITIVVSGQTGTTLTFETPTNQISLDASASTSTNAGALTYAWSIPAGAPSAVISLPGGNAATPLIQLSSGKVQYTITLTVTDSKGATATATITIRYP